jgi:hypothetical protein
MWVKLMFEVVYMMVQVWILPVVECGRWCSFEGFPVGDGVLSWSWAGVQFAFG